MKMVQTVGRLKAACPIGMAVFVPVRVLTGKSSS